MEETIFYVSGIALVFVALILAVVGLRRGEAFPNPIALRIGSVLFAALVFVVATAAVLSARDEQQHREHELAAEEKEKVKAGGGAAEELKVSVASGSELAFEQSSLSTSVGPTELLLDNRSDVAHDVAVEEGGKELGKTQTVSASTASTNLDLKAGDYVFFCTVPGHREAGMEGKLTVK